ncbi:MAG: MFS transporter [Clostridiales bacterium]|nr:MFS transporter [Clostridiales bacterium]
MNKDLKNMIIIFWGFFCLSLFSNTLSPFITTIKSIYGVSDNIIVLLPSVVYCSSFIMSIAASKFMHMLKLKRGLYISFLLVIFSSIVILLSKSFYILLFGYFLSGLALGMGGLFLGTLISLLPKKYQKFGFANACFGIGGILILPIDRLVLRNGISFNYTYIIHIVLMAVLIVLSTGISGISLPKDNLKHRNSLHILKNPRVLILSIAVFFYVGAEISTTNWTGSFLERDYGINKGEVPDILFGFWILFTLGRAFGDKLLENIGQLKFLLISPIASIAGIFVILLGTEKLQALIGLSIIGISISLIYPALQGYIIQHVSFENIPSASSVIVIFNNLGAAFLTYIIGFAGGKNITYVFIIQIAFFVYIASSALHYVSFKPQRN